VDAPQDLLPTMKEKILQRNWRGSLRC
jgi:hypothetical protein